jgi:ADP-ribosyl-[dinitrogen reductase] hydrolase
VVRFANNGTFIEMTESIDFPTELQHAVVGSCKVGDWRMETLQRGDRVLGALWGAIDGDALGVPVEFRSRQGLSRDPVTDMRGHGSHHQPAGTWSDDSSLMLCTIESLLSGFDTENLGHKFVRWLSQGYWTPWGKVFDIGGATQSAIRRMVQGVPPEEAGGDDEYSNGNGSLMRILPIALRFADAPSSELLVYAHRTSSLTHRHRRSQIACGFYCLMIADLVKGFDPTTAYRHAIEAARTYYEQPRYSDELPHFERLFSGRIGEFRESEIRSSGYVIDTLEASVWCCLTTESFKAAVLRAVNLGEDTDTTGTVTGGLAGACYGVQAITQEWLDHLARCEDIKHLFDTFAKSQ